jgi:hypothetical protein
MSIIIFGEPHFAWRTAKSKSLAALGDDSA